MLMLISMRNTHVAHNNRQLARKLELILYLVILKSLSLCSNERNVFSAMIEVTGFRQKIFLEGGVGFPVQAVH